jgi:hypothetical protein
VWTIWKTLRRSLPKTPPNRAIQAHMTPPLPPRIESNGKKRTARCSGYKPQALITGGAKLSATILNADYQDRESSRTGRDARVEIT